MHRPAGVGPEGAGVRAGRITLRADSAQSGLALAGSADAIHLGDRRRTSTWSRPPWRRHRPVPFDFARSSTRGMRRWSSERGRTGRGAPREELLSRRSTSWRSWESRGVGLGGGNRGRAQSSRLDSGLDVMEQLRRLTSGSTRPTLAIRSSSPSAPIAGGRRRRPAGAQPLGLPALQAALCDARVHRSGEKNGSTISPARRREVLSPRRLPVSRLRVRERPLSRRASRDPTRAGRHKRRRQSHYSLRRVPPAGPRARGPG